MVLGLVGDWGPADVKQSYRRLVSVAHPDVGGNAEQFRRVQTAYELLQNCSAAELGTDRDQAFWSHGGDSGDYRMATGAMAYLAVEPDLLDHLADICNAWEGQIAQVHKAAIRQLGWLVVGVVPVGAVISAAKLQKYRAPGRRFLGALQSVKRGDAMASAAAWDELGRTYVEMLGLLDLEAAAAAVDLTAYGSFLQRLHTALAANDASDVFMLMEEAQRFGRLHDLGNFAVSNATSTPRSSRTTTQRLAFAMGKKIGSHRR